MSDPVTNVEIEDVLSSIRRLVSEEDRSDSPAAPKEPAEPSSVGRLVLTPALRVPEPVEQDAAPEESSLAPSSRAPLDLAAALRDPESEFESEPQTADTQSEVDIPEPYAADAPSNVSSEVPADAPSEALSEAPWRDPKATLFKAAQHAEPEEDTQPDEQPNEDVDSEAPEPLSHTVDAHMAWGVSLDEEPVVLGFGHSPEPDTADLAEDQSGDLEDSAVEEVSEPETLSESMPDLSAETAIDDPLDATPEAEQDEPEPTADLVLSAAAEIETDTDTDLDERAETAHATDISEVEAEPFTSDDDDAELTLQQAEPAEFTDPEEEVDTPDPVLQFIKTPEADPADVPEDDQNQAQESPAEDLADLDPLDRAEALSAKIQALEEAIGRTKDQWEPDGKVGDDYAGTETETLHWQDHTQTEAETVTEDHATAAADDQADAMDVLISEEAVLDEESLRELVSEIVREELQGALGERITRNVRKLVRREIHRALAAQDLD